MMTARGARLAAALALLFVAGRADAFTYVSQDLLGTDSVSYMIGYGTGPTGPTTFGIDTDFVVTVGIDPTSMFATDIETSVINVVDTFNDLDPTVGNLDFGTIDTNQVDFESVLLHEMGHSLGLGHVNLASESGFTDQRANFTDSEPGADGVLTLNPGADNVIGSGDDVRGDDLNHNYFRIGSNDPFDTNLPNVIDSSTYTRSFVDGSGASTLPSGDLYSANPDRAVAGVLGYSATEGVMQQGSFFGEVQRTLSADDVAGIRYAQSGFDHQQGTADDYVFTLQYVGFVDNADITIDFDDTETGFAVAQTSFNIFGGDAFLTDADIFFNTGFNWAFTESPVAVPLPASVLMLLGGLGAMSAFRRSARVSG
ncbi:MAG: VPLPA-CTERM sorting domain-containing protein [Pseudomonadota bacterium]